MHTLYNLQSFLRITRPVTHSTVFLHTSDGAHLSLQKVQVRGTTAAARVNEFVLTCVCTLHAVNAEMNLRFKLLFYPWNCMNIG